MCGQTMQVITPHTRPLAASRFLLPAGVVGAYNL
jgi:hypothetical protein